MTRAARIEYAHHGGRCDGDFIDNAAGVATSDLEVNIQIAVDRAVATRSLPPDERHELLDVVTDAVADAALTTCLDQALALECAESAASALLDRHERLIEDLEFLGRIDRDRDGLPHPKDIRERARAGRAEQFSTEQQQQGHR